MNPSHPRPARSLAAAIVFFVLSGLGLVGTWAFNIAYFRQGGGTYVGDWFANAAAASAAVDLLVMAAAACVVMVVERARLGMSRWVWLLIPLSFAIAVAFTFPLFLGLRELTLRRRSLSAGTDTAMSTS